ncbi:hypothetical protein QNI16_23495 [Cytophagaceae bacterium YF14B1]|uniref:Uncharacterized protein n=1 Tax=Xanthocytophaga flava TaxID=3048013 RepID=A0AAE3UAM5_9BACT|nr:hypothetical protein [Xanthocytophaga flavus]MDJ1483483.1 hypothetical protein [Xanthocytophaga flavus]
MKFYCLLIIFFVCGTCVTKAQKDQVEDEIRSSFDYSKKVLTYVEESISYMNKCKHTSSLEDAKLYAKRAKNEIDYAIRECSNAVSDASDAESEASDIRCDDTESEADDAEEEFSAAKTKFDDAYTYLRRAENASDSDEFIQNYKRSLSAIEDGIEKIRSGQVNLREALNNLNSCKAK